MIVIGNGLVAKAFKNHSDQSDIVLFASGVSDSKTADRQDFEREQNLLLETVSLNRKIPLIYFSTCGIYDPDMQSTAYVRHKLLMENLIQKNSDSFIIFRVSNIVGFSNNKNTIFNYFINRLLNHEKISVWKHAYRNFADIDFVTRSVLLFLEDFSDWKNRTVNIAMKENTSVLELVYTLMDVYQMEAEIDLIDKGNNYSISVEDLCSVFMKKGMEVPSVDLKELITKYKRSF